MKLFSQGPVEVRRGVATRQASAGQRGIALVITLILLAIITFMAIAFLVLSSSQRNAVTTSTDQNIARNAAESGNARAIADLLSSIVIYTNPFVVPPRVSVNYINPDGFKPGVSSPTNVNFDYLYGTANNAVPTPLSPADRLQNLTNLLYDPRVPVWIVTNQTTGSNEFRFYVDLNRNRRFDPTGNLPVTNVLGQRIPNQTANVVGDPQWIGGLEFPERTHSADNPFTYRWAYMIVPESQTLDVNYMHNYAKHVNPAMLPGTDSFLRNQGAGTWEENLAGFLVDLNTNIWATNVAPYNYYADPLNYTRANTGVAFDDALAVLKWRYANQWSTLASVNTMFGAVGASAFDSDYIDGYVSGPPMTGTIWPGVGNDRDSLHVNQGWSGAFNTNHYFSIDELLDPSKTGLFATRLQNAGNSRNTYDQYTYYRLLSQLGTESAPETPGKINLNYDNLVRTNGQGLSSGTNFMAWLPEVFFTNAAMKLMTNAGFTVGQGYTNLLVQDNRGTMRFQIEVWPTNYYSPSVHRMLQLAANIYDATTSTNRPPLAQGAYPHPPTVFRPLFRRAVVNTPTGTTNAVFIVGYREIRGSQFVSVAAPPMVAVENGPNAANAIPLLPAAGAPITFNPNDRQEPMVTGIPLVVGVKKGFPNFNEFSMQTAMNVTRLLEFHRPGTSTTDPVTQTNQMYVFGITNAFGLEAWNSYSNAFPRPLQLIVSATMTASMTNELGIQLLSNQVSRGVITNLNSWFGWTGLGDVGQSFVLPFGTNNQFMFLTNSTYEPRLPGFVAQTHIFDKPSGFYVPRWYLNLNTRVICALVDVQADRIVDYVNLDHTEPTIDIFGKLAEGADCSGAPSSLNTYASQWCTNMSKSGAPQGVINQISLGLGMNGTTLPNIASFSQDPYAGLDAGKAVDGFRYNLMGWGPIYNPGQAFYKSNVFYAPFDPYNPLYLHTSWQANDPLVHYTIGDLVDLRVSATNLDLVSHNPPLDNLGRINNRYSPWGGSPTGSSNPDVSPTEMAAIDPMMVPAGQSGRSDYWDFPTNRLANVGWLGRVHRGTPWQTIYLKSPNFLLRKGFGVNQVNDSLATWQRWTGNPFSYVNYGQVSSSIFSNYAVYADSVFSLPTNDWRILDLFTTAFNDNATQGQLSVNQTNLDAWSAILSGVNVLPDATTNAFITPAGVYDPTAPPPLVRLVAGINNARTNFPNQSFQRLGDILATPELTVSSPYLRTNSPALNDDVVERIPQQILGLLKGGEAPRFVIYSYGQALKPAPKSIVTSGPYLGVCTNYAITAEVATRAVVRIDGPANHPRAVVEEFNVLPPN